MAAARKARPTPGLRERVAATKASAEKVIRQAPPEDPVSAPTEPAHPPTPIAEQLIDLNQRFEAFDEIMFEADVARGHAEGDMYPIVCRVAEKAEVHARRVGAECFQEAMELPATTVLELGLQARMIAREMHEWWGDETLQAGERACRVLLTRLIALAGLKRIHVPDVTAEELFGWLRDPEDIFQRLHPAGLPKTPATGAR
jgi:hypothetical protein